MRLADRKERFPHAQKGGRAGNRNKFERVRFSRTKAISVQAKETEMKIDNAAIEAGAQCRKIVMDG